MGSMLTNENMHTFRNANPVGVLRYGGLSVVLDAFDGRGLFRWCGGCSMVWGFSVVLDGFDGKGLFRWCGRFQVAWGFSVVWDAFDGRGRNVSVVWWVFYGLTSFRWY